MKNKRKFLNLNNNTILKKIKLNNDIATSILFIPKNIWYHYIFKHLSIIDKISISKTCKFFYNLRNEDKNGQINNEYIFKKLSEYFNYLKFDDIYILNCIKRLIKEGKIALSGSFLLYILTEPIHWKPNNIDLYLTDISIQELREYIEKEPKIFLGLDNNDRIKYAGFEVFHYYNDNYNQNVNLLDIQFIKPKDNKSIKNIVNGFDFRCLRNYYQNNKLYITSFNDIVSKKTKYNLNLTVKDSIDLILLNIRRLIKYVSRGFILEHEIDFNGKLLINNTISVLDSKHNLEHYKSILKQDKNINNINLLNLLKNFIYVKNTLKHKELIVKGFMENKK